MINVTGKAVVFVTAPVAVKLNVAVYTPLVSPDVFTETSQ